MRDEIKSPQTSAHSGANALFDLGFFSQAESSDGPDASSQKAGDFIGRYRLVAPLGEGGFGLVWQAEQTEPILRELALKLIKPGLNSREVIARFEAERQALALMDHPNISAVLDAGTTTDSRPYFAMELVKGEPITTYCDRHRLGIEERLALFIPVCRAVQHAHQKSILHRDLKPSNILVATVDGKPVPKVIDFGIAKALVGNDRPGLADQVRTQMGVAIGTPRYMSPEQAGSRPDVDTRSDIYSLGVVLCELLTGQSPHPAQPTEFLDALQWLREADPVKPSTLAQSATTATKEAAERRGTDSRRLARRLKGDLDWITLKALEKDRARRYETATALARDLERHLAEETVSAVAPTWRYQFGKFARRQRGALIAASLVVAALITGTVISLWQASQAKQSRAEAEHRFAQARDAVDKYLVRVVADPKLKQANFVNLQRELLETALPFFEDLNRYRGDDPKLLSEGAWAAGQLAILHQFAGDFPRAEAGYRQAVADLAKLAARFPNEQEYQLNLGLHLNGLANSLRLQAKGADALVESLRAVKIMEALTTRHPDVPNFQCQLARTLNDRAAMFDALGRNEEATEALRRVMPIGQRLVGQYPQTADYLEILATAANIKAHLLHRQKRFSEEVDVLREAIHHYEKAAKLGRASSDFHRNLMINRWRLGIALILIDQQKEAESVLRHAITTWQRYVDYYPSFGQYRSDVANVQMTLSENLALQKKDAESDAVLQQARMNLERLVSELPGETQYADQLGRTVASQNERARLRRDAAKAPEINQSAAVAPSSGASTVSYTDAVKQAQELATLHPTDWESLAAAAEGMAGALASIRADSKLSAAARDKQAEDGAAQAVEFLKQAMAHGYTGMAYFDTLPGAKALQQRPEYQAFLQKPVFAPPNSPRKFTFDYPFQDPGPRRWVRFGVTWTETQPSGAESSYTITGPFVLYGMPGAKVRRMSPTPQTAFVPALEEGKAQYLWILQADGKWVHFSAMRDVK